MKIVNLIIFIKKQKIIKITFFFLISTDFSLKSGSHHYFKGDTMENGIVYSPYYTNVSDMTFFICGKSDLV